jgi:KDO2-lipid IV(A) lauroyltransferase
MQFLTFIIVYPFIWLFSILPFRVLYFISDCFYYLIYYIIGYRKKTVLHNLKLVFPEKTDQEIKIITKKFYRHFTDVFIEMIKAFTLSEKAILEHYKFTNIEVVHELESKNKSAILIGSHYANWEWIFGVNLLVKYNGYAVFKKLKNPFFDKKIRETRGRYNTTLVPTKEIFNIIANNTKNNILSLYGFLGDQSPRLKKAHYWSEFLGVTVPIHTGAEMLAKKSNLSVVSFHVKKIKRGYYEATFKLLAENPNDFKDYDITDLYLRELEKSIYKAPEYYFWTHKRFKHEGKLHVDSKK